MAATRDEAERLARCKVPEHIIFRDELLPRTATGEVDFDIEQQAASVEASALAARDALDGLI